MDKTCDSKKKPSDGTKQEISGMRKLRLKLYLYSEGLIFPCASLLDEDVVLLLVIIQAKAVAGAKSHQLPL